MLGVPARELFEMRTSENPAAYDKVFADCLFKPVIARVRNSLLLFAIYFYLLCQDSLIIQSITNVCIMLDIPVQQLRVKQEMVNDEMRTKSTVMAISELDYVAENQKMLDAINKY